MPTLTKRGAKTATILELAARACGTNSVELLEHGITHDTGPGLLAQLLRTGRVVKLTGVRVGKRLAVHQFFARKGDADAWAALAPQQRPNLQLHSDRRPREMPQVQTNVQRATWRKAPMVGDPIAEPGPVGVSASVGSGFDPRYHVPASHRGEFSQTGIGRYSSDAASCAARAVR